MEQKFFLYARKSTDVEDKQVLSIEAQLQELRDYAKRENIEISAEIVEKESAKIPGRPMFNKMWILFPKIRNEGCARKYGVANIPLSLLWDISTTLAQKLSLWTKRPRQLFVARLSCTQKVTKHCKVSENILSATISLQKMERESTFPAQPLSSPTHFTTDIFDTT